MSTTYQAEATRNSSTDAGPRPYHITALNPILPNRNYNPRAPPHEYHDAHSRWTRARPAYPDTVGRRGACACAADQPLGSQAAAICCVVARASGKIRVSWLSDVVNRTKTRGRKPVARSSSGDPSTCSFPEAPGGFSAEPLSRPLSCPPRRLLYGRVSVFPSYGRLPAHLPSPRFFLGLLRLSGIAAAAAERGCSLGSAVTRLGCLATARGEACCCLAYFLRRRAR